MFTDALDVSRTLPREFRSVAGKLFPRTGPSLQAAASFANVLGIGEDYGLLLKGTSTEREMGIFLERFQNNLDLLIQKTWVEKADEARKNALLDKVPPFVSLIEKGDYREALREFGVILEELAYLFFGSQSQSDDFTEYTFRIDIEMGLFWWYVGTLSSPQGLEWAKSADSKVLLAVLLLGICYLTNF